LEAHPERLKPPFFTNLKVSSPVNWNSRLTLLVPKRVTWKPTASRKEASVPVYRRRNLQIRERGAFNLSGYAEVTPSEFGSKSISDKMDIPLLEHGAHVFHRALLWLLATHLTAVRATKN